MVEFYPCQETSPRNGGAPDAVFMTSRWCSTSRPRPPGSIRVELQDAACRPLPGYTAADARELIGKHIAREVSWAAGADVASLAGRAVRLRTVMRDADLFALRFR